jgi:Chaperone of endosialidase
VRGGTAGVIVDASITAADLAASAVSGGTAGVIADASITSADLADNAVIFSKIADKAIGAGKTTFAQTQANNSVAIHPTNANFNGPTDFNLYLDAPSKTIFYRKNATFVAEIGFDSANYFYIRRNVGDPGYLRIDSAGGTSKGSDARLKKDIEPATGMLNAALNIDPVYYRYKSETEQSQPHLGVVAQNVQNSVPDLVHGGESLSVDYAGLGVVAIGAIREQNREVVDQGGRIRTLEKENEELKARLERLERALIPTP